MQPPAASLRQRMIQFIQHWQRDLNPQWITWLAAIAPQPNAIRHTVTIPHCIDVIPGRKGAPPPGAPQNSHVFRAFDNIFPDDVCVVFLGRDPYPHVFRATGRAFEQGDLTSWTQRNPAATSSIRRIAQEAAAKRNNRPVYRRRRSGWVRLKNDLSQNRINFPNPQSLMYNWERQGVLFLNSALTFTEKSHQRDHGLMWEPFVGGICRKLALQTQPVVFVALGHEAQCGLRRALGVSGSRIQNTRKLCRFHPQSHKFFCTNNLLDDINQELIALGKRPINW